MHPAEISRHRPQLKLERQAVDLDYRNKAHCILTTGGTLCRKYPLKAATNKDGFYLAEIRQRFKLKLPKDHHFTALTSSKKDVVTACYSQEAAATWFFFLNENLSPKCTFRFDDQSAHVHSIKFVNQGKQILWAAVTAKGHLHILKSNKDNATVVLRDSHVHSSAVKGMCILNDSTALIYGSSTAVTINIMDF